MVADTTNISVRMDRTLKKEADELFGEMGMNLSTAFNIFVRQALRDRAFPFEITLEPKHNEETLQVIRDARKGIGLSEPFDNIDDLMEALDAED